MQHLKIKAKSRENFGKKGAADARREGMIPCVIYGGGETVHFSIEATNTHTNTCVCKKGPKSKIYKQRRIMELKVSFN